MDRQPATYVLASKRNGTIYVGVTVDLVCRTWQHREHLVDGFTQQHSVTTLVHSTMEAAITREKRIKKWNRDWKIRLIEESNPYWNDLWPQIIGQTIKVAGFPPARE